MKKAIFLHGFYATGSCPMAVALKDALKGEVEVLTPDNFPFNLKKHLPLFESIMMGYIIFLEIILQALRKFKSGMCR